MDREAIIIGGGVEITRLFFDAEDAFFNGIPCNNPTSFELEPLMAVFPKEPLYMKSASIEQLTEYRRRLSVVQERFHRLENDVGRKDKIQRVLTALMYAINDIGEQMEIRKQAKL